MASLSSTRRAILLPLLLRAQPSQRIQIPPRDESHFDPTFLTFRHSLARLIHQKDAQQLIPLLANDILSSYGADATIPEFLTFWNLDRPRSSPFWKELSEVLRLGCRRLGDSFHAPSIVRGEAQTNNSDNLLLTVYPRVRLHQSPSAHSPTLAILNWDRLERLGNDVEPVPRWKQVRTTFGPRGFVQSRFLRSPLSFNAVFAKREGTWRISVFVAGD